MTEQYEFHPLANKFRSLEGEEFEELVDDIRANGLREEIVLHDGMILDGRNRYHACRAAGVEPRYRIFDGSDPAAFVISANIHRRHLRADEKRPLIEAVIKAMPEKSNRQIAAETGVSHPHVAAVRNDMERAGDVERVTTTIDTRGRKQPKKSKKPKVAPVTKTPPPIKPKDSAAEAMDAESERLTTRLLTKLDDGTARELLRHLNDERFLCRLVGGLTAALSMRNVGNVVDPQDSAEARKTAFAEIESAPAPAAKKRGRPAGSKNKKKAA
jgi:ParB-like chromosome segregation protein Spo0J